MSIDHLLTESWTVQKDTESVGTSGEVISTFATDTDIGTAGVISAHFRNLSISEINQLQKEEDRTVARLYTKSTGITSKHRIVSPDGEVFQVLSNDNPHRLSEFFQIDLQRRDEEKEDDS